MILCLCPNPSVDTFIWLNGLTPGQANSIKQERRFAGGKGVHVALALQELNEPVIVLGFWGGPTGEWVRMECERIGIKCYGPTTEEWTRTCLTFKSEGQYNETELLGAGPTIAPEDFERFLGIFSELLPKSHGVTMSGSWPKGAPANAYAQLINRATRAGKKSFLDCTGEQLLHALTEKPHLVHLNRIESHHLFNESDLEKCAQKVAAKCKYAAITAGAEGLFLARNDELVHANCFIDNVYSAVGSGDCLMAGLVLASIKGLDLTETARLGVACGAANCLTPDLGMLYRRDVETLRKRAVIMKSKTNVYSR